MRFPRKAGVLLHLTSLPGSLGIGDFGPKARRFVDFLQMAGVHWWQVLPLGPTARGNSPYSSYSAFAGNPYLISPVELVRESLLGESELASAPRFDENEVEVDYERVGPWRMRLLESAFLNFQRLGLARSQRFLDFCNNQAWWLDDYALFMALVERDGEPDWSRWQDNIVRRESCALAKCRETLATRIKFQQFLQYEFHRQWEQLRQYARERSVAILGDIPIFVAYESADAWAHQDCFCLDEGGRRTVVAGVPPDYFSKTGQLWGNPLYRWDTLAFKKYDWWVKRLRHSLQIYDAVRVDHFRGFEAYWEVPADARTAATGRWVTGPGAAPFRAAEEAQVELRIIAEDLGSISDAVHALRDELNFPGMRVLQFGFDDDLGYFHRPQSFPEHSVGYTGTHDNDTLVGWLSERQRRRAATPDTRDRLLEHLGLESTAEISSSIHWELIRQVFASSADTAIVPLQDVLGLGSEARMNVPGNPDGNWRWRCSGAALTETLAAELRGVIEQTNRI
jgi:4-alpha-glucanotransferase